MSLDDNGIEYATYTYRINIKWTSVTGIVETDRYLHVYTDSKEEIFIPKKAFNNVEDLKNFIQKLNDMMNGQNQKELKGSE
ncbi:MAG: YcxB family protein [Clostridiaceae bacterium]